MRFRIATALVAVILFAGCSDPMAPNPATEITLPAFDQQAIEVQQGYTYIQSLTFYSPVGVDPVIDATSNTGAVKIVGTPERTAERDITCTSCVRTRWRVNVLFRAEELGEALVRAELRADTQKYSSFRVKVIPQYREPIGLK